MRAIKTVLAAIAMLVVSAGIAQQTTEKFIPIGMSPGISGKLSYRGEVVAVDAGAGSFSMQSDGATRTISMDSSTKIWLDRSKIKKPNADGNFGDLKSGLQIEVMYRLDNQLLADWIKIESR